MSKVIVYTRPDGAVSLCHPLIADDDSRGATSDQAFERVLRNDIPHDARDVKVIDKSALPSDRIFREAWRQTSSGVGVDMQAARVTHLDRLRAERNAALGATDKLILRASELGLMEDVARLAALRQALRDVPQAVASEVETAATPDQLKEVRPPVLSQAGSIVATKRS